MTKQERKYGRNKNKQLDKKIKWKIMKDEYEEIEKVKKKKRKLIKDMRKKRQKENKNANSFFLFLM